MAIAKRCGVCLGNPSPSPSHCYNGSRGGRMSYKRTMAAGLSLLGGEGMWGRLAQF